MYKKASGKEIVLILGSTLVTVVTALLIIRWLAPGLLGITKDLVLVKSSEEVVPYYEQIFNRGNAQQADFLLNDPFTKIRARQFFPDQGSMGPHDILGFRNRSVPNTADIVTIGDSQTYGNTARMWENWPHQLEAKLPLGTRAYSMATGGWGALQYYYAYQKSLTFQPKVVVVAFYTGNDPIETFSFAQASELWSDFVPKQVDLDDLVLPKTDFPAPVEQQWKVDFADGVSTVFTPELRHVSNMKVAAIDVAYEMMFGVAKAIGDSAAEHGIKPIFTIIPTKEYVYLRKIKKEGISINPAYKDLIEDESFRINWLAEQLATIEGSYYVDVAARLQREALANIALYPQDINGHPTSKGYKVIANEMAAFIDRVYEFELGNGIAIYKAANGAETPVYISEGYFWVLLNARKYINQLKTLEGIDYLQEGALNNLHYKGYKILDELLEKRLIGE